MIFASLIPEWLRVSYATILLSASIWIPLFAIILKKLKPNTNENTVMGICFCIVCLPFFVTFFIILLPFILLAFIFCRDKKTNPKPKITNDEIAERIAVHKQYIENKNAISKKENDSFSTLKILFITIVTIFVILLFLAHIETISGRSAPSDTAHKSQNNYFTRHSPHKTYKRDYCNLSSKHNNPFVRWAKEQNNIDKFLKEMVEHKEKLWTEQQNELLKKTLDVKKVISEMHYQPFNDPGVISLSCPHQYEYPTTNEESVLKQIIGTENIGRKSDIRERIRQNEIDNILYNTNENPKEIKRKIDGYKF